MNEIDLVANDMAARERNLNSLSTITLAVTLGFVTMTFGALVSVFLLRGLQPELWAHIQLPGILWASTVVLIASSVLFQRAHKQLKVNAIEAFNRLMAWTIGLGVLFLLGQVAAGAQILSSGVVLTNNPHCWFIFLFGGLHGLHIIAGLVGLIVLWYRTRERVSGPRYQMGTRAAAKAVGIFWHYMDGMWLLLFGLLIFWRR
jgi:cytochrome c oxidase subunit 3